MLNDIFSNSKTYLIKTKDSNFQKIINSNTNSNNKICLLLTKSIFEKNILNKKNYYIDILSSYYHNEKIISKNCNFISPKKNEIIDSIKNSIIKKKCSVIAIEDVSSLLNYFQRHEIQEILNSIKINHKSSTKIIIMTYSEDYLAEEIKKLEKDLRLFSDKIINL